MSSKISSSSKTPTISSPLTAPTSACAFVEIKVSPRNGNKRKSPVPQIPQLARRIRTRDALYQRINPSTAGRADPPGITRVARLPFAHNRPTRAADTVPNYKSSSRMGSVPSLHVKSRSMMHGIAIPGGPGCG